MPVPATQKAILAAAKKVLQERGLEGFTTNAVAEGEPFSVGTVHNYYPNKAQLLRALIRRECEALEPWLRSPPPASNQLEYVRQIVTGLLAYHRGAPQLAWLLYVEERRQNIPPKGSRNVFSDIGGGAFVGQCKALAHPEGARTAQRCRESASQFTICALSGEFPKPVRQFAKTPREFPEPPS